MSGKDFKIVLGGAFGSGRSTFAKSIVQAKKDSKKIRTPPPCLGHQFGHQY